MSVEFRAVREEERDECVRLWCTVWQGDNEDYFRRYFYGDVEWLPYYTQVAVVEGKIVSAVQICKRMVGCGDFQLTMGGIANVATLPEYRGQGYNTECLKRAITVMEADAMDFSLLFTGINDYYARLGYATWPRKGLLGTVREDFIPRPTVYTVRPARGEDLPAVYSLYNVANRQRPIAVQRSEAYWRDWIGLSPAKDPTDMLVAVDANGVVRGYVRYGVFRSAIPYSADEVKVRVTEFGVETHHPPAELELIIALLDGITAFFLEQGTRKVRLDIAVDTLIQWTLDAVLELQEHPISNSGMVRLLHRENLLQSFAMLQNDRWIAAGRPTGTLTFATPYGPVSLHTDGSFLRVASTDEATSTLPQEALFGLLFGSLTPKEVTPDTALHPLLEALFPPRAPVYWGADGF